MKNVFGTNWIVGFFVMFAATSAHSQGVGVCEEATTPSECQSLNCAGIFYNCSRPPPGQVYQYSCYTNSAGEQTGGLTGTDALICKRVTWSPCEESGHLAAFISGRKNDIVTLRNSSGKVIWGSGPIEKGKLGDFGSRIFGKRTDSVRCNEDLHVFKNYATIRHGANLDLFHFIGVNSAGSASQLTVRLQDGSHHGIDLTDRGPLIRLGRKKDVYIQYCFDGSKWSSSDIKRNGLRHDFNCNDDAITFFNGISAGYSPPRPLPICHSYPKDYWHPKFDDVRCYFTCDPNTGEISYDKCYDYLFDSKK